MNEVLHCTDNKNKCDYVQLTCKNECNKSNDCQPLQCIYKYNNYEYGTDVDVNIFFQKYYDNEADAYYWYNPFTGEATWEDPLSDDDININKSGEIFLSPPLNNNNNNNEFGKGGKKASKKKSKSGKKASKKKSKGGKKASKKSRKII
jgi:hypothetical protein